VAPRVFFVVSFAFKPRTNLAMNFVRLLSAKVRDLTAARQQLRLQTARQRMLMDGFDATTAAYEVGYESVSQFSREYSRFFGLSPIRDVKTLKNVNRALVSVV
jgi:AraC-like DNA-binding protein